MAKRRALSELSPAYRRRIQRAIDRGTATAEGSRQIARGKTSREYAQRQQNRKSPPTTLIGGLTPGQKGQVSRHAKFMSAFDPSIEDDDDVAELIAALQEWTALHGYQRFVALRALQRGLAADYRAERAAGTYSIRQGLLQVFTAQFEIADVRWFFYH